MGEEGNKTNGIVVEIHYVQKLPHCDNSAKKLKKYGKTYTGHIILFDFDRGGLRKMKKNLKDILIDIANIIIFTLYGKRW